MRFTSVPLALLALAPSVVPGVYAVPSAHANALAVRQDGLVSGLVTAIQGLIKQLTGSLPTTPQTQQITETIANILGALENRSLAPRADATASAGPSASGMAPSPVSISIPKQSAKPLARMRRQPAFALLD